MVFERLFGDGGTADERRAEMRRDRSILDSVTDDMARLVNSLGASDRVRGWTSTWTPCARWKDASSAPRRRRANRPSRSPTVPVGIPETYDEHARLLLDLLLLTYQADITRVFSLQARPRAERPHLPLDRRERRPPRGLPSPGRPAEDGLHRRDQHVPHRAAVLLRREAGRDAGRRGQPARPLDGAARQRHEQRQPPRPQEPAARPGRGRGGHG